MTYIQQFEAELKEKLQNEKDVTVLMQWISEKVLESYRNGIKAGNKGVQVIRGSKSRRVPPQA